MLLLIHHQNKVVAVKDGDKQFSVLQPQNIAKQLFTLAKDFPDALIVWCESSQKDNLNLIEIPRLFHHHKIIHSYGNSTYLGDSIGFVEDSPFIKINPKVPYPTWQLSSMVGGITARVLNAIAGKIPSEVNFDYFLNSLGKLVMPQGIFCYNNPNLLIEIPKKQSKKGTSFDLFRFVKQHYKTRWNFLLFLNMIYYEKKFPVFPLISALFYKNRNLPLDLLDKIPLVTNKKAEAALSLDVVIPTIGRKKYVYAVLKDLADQSLLPKKVILVEQNTDLEHGSELDFLASESWPFEVKHIFIRQTGACNARNLALNEVTAAAVFLADDDIRMGSNFLEQACKKMIALQVEAVTLSCLQEGEMETIHTPIQWKSFGSGCSIVYTKTLKDIRFDMGFENGFGEDADFGMELRNKGVDVIYLPHPQIIHLKAPVGGFRSKPQLEWENEPIQPKPSPTIMLFHLKHRTKEQRQGYKTTLFFKYYPKQSVKNPFRYFRIFKAQWNQSVIWAEKLARKDRY